jgi:tRNA pseudouridine55 synthase
MTGKIEAGKQDPDSAPPPRPKKQNIHGWIVLDKPQGLTSTRALGQVKWLYNALKAGHAGTLDPLAEGILPLAFGEATKTVPFLVDARKTYEFTVRWGAETTTDDLEGQPAQTSSVRPDPDVILAALPAFLGEIWQTPPAFSAVKVDGERAYDLARSGAAPELAARQVTIHRIEILDHPDSSHTRFLMVCGKGTYVRAFARDMGRKLGCFGHISALRRTRVGPFGQDDAVTLEKLGECANTPAAKSFLLPISTALDDIPALAVTDQEAALLRRGQAILARGRVTPRQGPRTLDEPDDEAVAVYCRSRSGDPVALGDFVLGEIRPTRVFTFTS